MIPVSPMLSELAEAWLAAMIRASWQGGIALGLVWAVCRCLPRLPPRYRCWLWRLALLKLLVAALVATTIDLAVLPSSWTGGPFGGVWRSPPPAASPQAVLPVSAAGAEPETLGDVPLKAADAPGVSDPEGVSTAAASTASRIPVILFLLWLAALLGLVGLVARRIVAARRWRRQCVLVKDPLILAMGEGLARQFGLVQPPLLFAADFCRSPVVFGTMRTAIVLPASLMAWVTAAEMRLILAHEMAHIRRGDLLGNWFASIVSGLFFFHPLVWVAFREIRLSQEMACDELALRQRDVSLVDYGRLIVDLATRYCQRPSVVVAVGVVESFQHSLKRRLSAMKSLGTPSWRVLVLSWFLAAVALLGLLPWRVVAQSGPDAGQPAAGSSAEVEKAAAEGPQAPQKKCPERIVEVKTTSGPYTITVDRVRRDFGHGISMTPSGFPMTGGQSFQETHTESSEGGSVSATAAGMGGGSAGGFLRPNLILDLEVKSPKSSKKHLLCAVNGKVRGEDDQGHSVESPDIPTWLRLQLPDVNYRQGSGRTAIHLFLPASSPAAMYLRSVEGELLVAEGTLSRVQFTGKDLQRPTTKRAGGVAVELKQFRQTPQGIDVTLAVSPPDLSRISDPMERMQRMMGSQGRVSVVLEDSQGEAHTAVQSDGTGNAGSSSTFTTGGGSGGTASGSGGGAWSRRATGGMVSGSGGRSWSKRVTGGTMSGSTGGSSFGWSSGGQQANQDWPTQVLHFDPLPKGVKPKAVKCMITDRTGEPKTVPFRLQDIPLPEAQAN